MLLNLTVGLENFHSECLPEDEFLKKKKKKVQLSSVGWNNVPIFSPKVLLKKL